MLDPINDELPLRPAPDGAGLRLNNTPAACHPLPKGEGRYFWCVFEVRKTAPSLGVCVATQGREGVRSAIRWDRTLEHVIIGTCAKRLGVR